ncbi:NUDIX hydrolase [Candidatus Poriferisodalis sp.]|uniref:NUDIX hydrolase n=1 Tax=Candidatus Poriferisodalis sp. TaxID=3101277 RepID=UPI003B01C2BC
MAVDREAVVPEAVVREAGDLGAAMAVAEAFKPRDRVQATHRRRMIDFMARHPDALHRSCEVGHVTASAWVVSDDATKGLVLLHRKIGRWLQPGGHADGERALAGVALREATEETGIDGLEVWTEPIDIDIHLVVSRLVDSHLAVSDLAVSDLVVGHQAVGQGHAEPDHLHFDVRYLVRAPRHAVPSGNHESEQLRWIGRHQLDEPRLNLDASTRRLARYGFELAAAVALRRQ